MRLAVAPSQIWRWIINSYFTNMERYTAELALNIGMSVIFFIFESMYSQQHIKGILDELFDKASRIPAVKATWMRQLEGGVSTFVEKTVISDKSFTRLVTATKKAKDDDAQHSSYKNFSLVCIASIVLAYVMVVFKHLSDVVDPACIDAFVSWSTTGKINKGNVNDLVNLGYSPFAKLNGSRILKCIESIRKIDLPVSVNVIDFIASMLGQLGFLRKTIFSSSLGIILNSHRTQALRLVGNAIQAVPSVMHIINVAQKMLEIQMYTLNKMANVDICPTLRLTHENQLHGKNTCCKKKEEIMRTCTGHCKVQNSCSGQ